MDMLQVKDVATRQVFKLRPGDNVTYVTTRDGVRVKLHPVVIKLMVKKGSKFAGSSVLGDREMVKL